MKENTYCELNPTNIGLICYKQNCESCGWNPKIDCKRRAEDRAKLEAEKEGKKHD